MTKHIALFYDYRFKKLLEEVWCHCIEGTAPGQELMSGAWRYVALSLVTSSIEIVSSLLGAYRILLLAS